MTNKLILKYIISNLELKIEQLKSDIFDLEALNRWHLDKGDISMLSYESTTNKRLYEKKLELSATQLELDQLKVGI